MATHNDLNPPVVMDANAARARENCSGVGGHWGTGTGAPICPVCHVGPRGIGVSKPRRRNGRWTGKVPTHQRRNQEFRTAVIKEARA